MQVRAEEIAFVVIEAAEEVGPTAGEIHVVFDDPVICVLRELAIKGEESPVGIPFHPETAIGGGRLGCPSFARSEGMIVTDRSAVVAFGISRPPALNARRTSPVPTSRRSRM